ncbi:UCHL5 hydrolase, partial [Polypterus senegalus]
MAGSAGEWCLMESDPGVFTELIKGFGCKGAQVEEIWSMEPENFEKLKQQMFEFDAKSTAKDEDAFHFVSYVPVSGRLYELDGLREGPIDLDGPRHHVFSTQGPERHIVAQRGGGEDKVRGTKIMSMYELYSEGEIRFNLMAIVSDRKMIYERKISELQSQLTEVENIRRKHNYLPFIMELLKTLAEFQQLIPLVEKKHEQGCPGDLQPARLNEIPSLDYGRQVIPANTPKPPEGALPVMWRCPEFQQGIMDYGVLIHSPAG